MHLRLLEDLCVEALNALANPGDSSRAMAMCVLLDERWSKPGARGGRERFEGRLGALSQMTQSHPPRPTPAHLHHDDCSLEEVNWVVCKVWLAWRPPDQVSIATKPLSEFCRRFQLLWRASDISDHP